MENFARNKRHLQYSMTGRLELKLRSNRSRGFDNEMLPYIRRGGTSSGLSTSTFSHKPHITTTTHYISTRQLLSCYLVTSLSLFIILCSSPGRVAANPTITFISKDQIVNIGDDLELRCNFVDSEGYSIGWTRIDSSASSGGGGGRVTTIARGTSLDVPSERFHASFDARQSQYVLRIDQVNENDAGVYQCQIAQGTSMPQTARTNVFVRIPPSINDNSTRSVITAVGSDLQMHCYATGYPQPTISWRRNKNSLIPVNGGVAIHRANTLALKNVTKFDRGTYYCVADNGVSPGARRGISVEVEFRPVVRVGQPRYEQALQYDADLHCTVEAFPSPSITWLKDGHELSNNQHYSVAIFDTSNEFSQTTLRVKKIEKRQYGVYQCRAANKFGVFEAEVRLDETPNVVCPPACDTQNYLTAGAGQWSASSWPRVHLLMFSVSLLVFYKLTRAHHLTTIAASTN